MAADFEFNQLFIQNPERPSMIQALYMQSGCMLAYQNHPLCCFVEGIHTTTYPTDIEAPRLDETVKILEQDTLVYIGVLHIPSFRELISCSSLNR